MAKQEGEIKITEEELERFQNAMKNEEFRKMFSDYAKEISHPENRKKYEEEIAHLEAERGMDVKFIKPQNGFVVKTAIKSENGMKAFINMSHSDVITKASFKQANQKNVKGQDWTIPYSLNQPRDDFDKVGKKCKVYDIIFNTQTFQIGQKDARFKQLMINTAFDGIEKNWNVKLDRKNLKYPKMSFKGVKTSSVIRTANNKGTKNPGADIEIGNTRLPYPYKEETQEQLNGNIGNRNRVKKSENLHEPNDYLSPVSTTYTPKYTIVHRGHIDLQNFTFSRDSRASSTQPKELVVNIDLPLCETAAGIDLDIFEKQLVLKSSDPNYHLDISLPYNVKEREGRAQFDKSKRRLSVTLPVLPTSLVTVSSHESADGGSGNVDGDSGNVDGNSGNGDSGSGNADDDSGNADGNSGNVDGDSGNVDGGHGNGDSGSGNADDGRENMDVDIGNADGSYENANSDQVNEVIDRVNELHDNGNIDGNCGNEIGDCTEDGMENKMTTNNVSNEKYIEGAEKNNCGNVGEHEIEIERKDVVKHVDGNNDDEKSSQFQENVSFDVETLQEALKEAEDHWSQRDVTVHHKIVSSNERETVIDLDVKPDDFCSDTSTMGNVVAKMDEILFSNENKDSNSDGNVFNEPKFTDEDNESDKESDVLRSKDKDTVDLNYEDAEEFEVVENSDGDDDVEPQKLTTVQEIETVNENKTETQTGALEMQKARAIKCRKNRRRRRRSTGSHDHSSSLSEEEVDSSARRGKNREKQVKRMRKSRSLSFGSSAESHDDTEGHRSVRFNPVPEIHVFSNRADKRKWKEMRKQQQLLNGNTDVVVKSSPRHEDEVKIYNLKSSLKGTSCDKEIRSDNGNTNSEAEMTPFDDQKSVDLMKNMNVVATDDNEDGFVKVEKPQLTNSLIFDLDE